MEVSVAKLNIANLKKTLYYLQRNGLRETWISVRERLTETDRYFYVPCPEEEQERQSCRKWDNPVTLSIVVPLYRTPEIYLNRMITVSYTHLEHPSVVFPTEDPNLTIRVDALDRKAENILTVKMEIVQIPLAVASDMAGCSAPSADFKIFPLVVTIFLSCTGTGCPFMVSSRILHTQAHMAGSSRK